MKKYTIEVVVNEVCDEFFEELNKTNSTGCDDIVKIISNALSPYGLHDNIKLIKFIDD